MKKITLFIIAYFVCLSADSFVFGMAATAVPRINSIKAREKTLTINLAGSGQKVDIVELRPYQQYESDKNYPVVWQGKAQKKSIIIDRFDGKKDRLFSKYQLVDTDSKNTIGHPQYVTDLSLVSARDFEIPWPKSIKGLACIRDVNDAAELGVKYANENVTINSLLDITGKTSELSWQVDGVTIGIDADFVRKMDEKLSRMTKAGINVTLVLLNKSPDGEKLGGHLAHPLTDCNQSPYGLGAFNLTNEEGLRYYRAAVEFLADRYTMPDKKYGLISGIIIGNELQSHWVWYNIGQQPAETVIKEYATAVRIAGLSMHKTHRGLRTYISMDHFWSMRGLSNDPLKELTGLEVINGVNNFSNLEGNFQWHVAFHPYPENFFEPRFWLDKTALFDFNTPRITFKNIEVLPAYLEQSSFKYNGKARRIILSEQGFHTPADANGQKVQAACYAYAYYKIKQIKGIDAFMYFTHVSSVDPMSCGLDLGLCKAGPGGEPVFTPGSHKYIWEVVRLADTEKWQQAFEFAKPITGIADWSQIRLQEVNKKK